MLRKFLLCEIGIFSICRAQKLLLVGKAELQLAGHSVKEPQLVCKGTLLESHQLLTFQVCETKLVYALRFKFTG